MMRMKLLSFEGTVQEFEEVSHLFTETGMLLSQAVGTASGSAEATSEEPEIKLEGKEEGSEKSLEITERGLRKVLTRRPMSTHQKSVFNAITAAGTNGIISTDLAAETGLTRPQIAGVMGALGRRVANTPGWPKKVFLFDGRWDEEVHEWRYKHWPVVRDMLQSGAVEL